MTQNPLGKQKFNTTVRAQTPERLHWFMNNEDIDTPGQALDAITALAFYIRQQQATGAVFGMNPAPANGDVANPRPVTFLGHWDLQGPKRARIHATIRNNTRVRLEWLMHNDSIAALGDIVDVVTGLAVHIRQQQANGAEFCISPRGDFTDGTRLAFFGLLDPDPSAEGLIDYKPAGQT